MVTATGTVLNWIDSPQPKNDERLAVKGQLPDRAAQQQEAG